VHIGGRLDFSAARITSPSGRALDADGLAVEQSHTKPTAGSQMREHPAGHLDRAWPGTGRKPSQQVADERMSASPSGPSPATSVVLQPNRYDRPSGDCSIRHTLPTCPF
jgi:hypothetical protein